MGVSGTWVIVNPYFVLSHCLPGSHMVRGFICRSTKYKEQRTKSTLIGLRIPLPSSGPHIPPLRQCVGTRCSDRDYLPTHGGSPPATGWRCGPAVVPRLRSFQECSSRIAAHV